MRDRAEQTERGPDESEATFQGGPADQTDAIETVDGDGGKVSWALWLASFGLSVFLVWGTTSGVCDCPRGEQCSATGKHPIHAGWQQESATDAAVISRLWAEHPNANVGVDCGKSGVVVVDVDPRNGGDASLDDWFATTEDADQLLPETLRIRTGGGGVHLFYSAPPGVEVRSKTGWLSGVDVKACGGYVVGAGSRHASGQLYIPESPLTSIAGLPNEFLEQELFGGSRGESRRIQNRNTYLEDAANVPGGEQRAYLLSYAGSMLSRGYSREDGGVIAWEIARRFTNTDPDNPWTKTHTDSIINDYWDNREGPAVIAPELVSWATQLSEASGRASRGQRIEIQRAADLRTRPPRPALIEGLLPAHGLAQLVGPSGSGKTMLAVHLGGCIANDLAFLGHDVESPGAVVFVIEEGAWDFPKRLKAWLAEHPGAVDDRLFVAEEQAVNLLDDRDVDALVAALASLDAAPALVVIDTQILHMPGGDENSARDISVLIESLRRISKETGGVVLTVHHPGHEQSRARGSSAQRAAWDVELTLKDGLLRQTKNRYGPSAAPMGVAIDSNESGPFVRETSAIAAAASAAMGLEAKIIEVVRQTPGILKGDCYHHVQGAKFKFNAAIDGLIADGRLRSERGSGTSIALFTVNADG